MPPNYNELPIPELKDNKNNNKNQMSKNNIKKMLTNEENINSEDNKTDDVNQNIEEVILKKIKKN